jgi:hypothetical protein
MDSHEYDAINKLYFFQTLVGLDEAELAIIDRYKAVFVENKKTFSEDFMEYFHELRETRLYLEDEQVRKRLLITWAHWFEDLFLKKFNRDFVFRQWKSGLRHVEIKIDHKFITLGYSVLRQFCQKISQAQILWRNNSR